MVEIVKLTQGKGQCIMHMNAQSIRNKFPLLQKELKGQEIEILLFSETWLTSMNHDDDYFLENYNLYRWDRIRRIRAGGLCAYIDDHLTCSSTALQHLNVSTLDIEIQWLRITKGKARQMIVGNLYRPPEGDKTVFVNLLKGMLSKINELDNYDVILTGDFNIDVLPDSNIKDLLYSNMEDFGLRQLIHEPTRTKAAKTCIDLIFTNIINVSASGVALLNTSDHLPVYMTIKKEKVKRQPRSFKGRSYKNYDSNTFCNKFLELSWDIFDDSNDVEYCWELFSNNIKKVLDVLCPIREFRVKYKDEPWLTPELTAQIIEKNNALKKARRTNNILDWDSANTLKNICCTNVKKSKTKLCSR